MDNAYDKIDRFLRNNLDDADYAEYSAALDEVLSAAPQQQAEPVAECKDDGEGGVYYATLSNRAPIGLLYTSPVPRITAEQIAELKRLAWLVENKKCPISELHAVLDALVKE